MAAPNRAAPDLVSGLVASRPAALAILPLLHVVSYWLTTRITVLRGPGALVDTTTRFDPLIPYVPESWPLYWVAYVFVVGAGGYALFRMSERMFRRAVLAAGGMMFTGALIQTILPAQAPWPPNPALSQRLFHDSPLILPYATLPSMHVAYCTLAAGLISHVVPGLAVRVLGAAVAVAVALSTLLLREHVILDAVTGFALAAATVWWWKRGGP